MHSVIEVLPSALHTYLRFDGTTINHLVQKFRTFFYDRRGPLATIGFDRTWEG